MARVFQWASGTVGRHAALEVAARREHELIGLHTLSESKSGRDVGVLLGAEPFGIVATNDIAAVTESDADVVLHTPLASLVYAEEPEQDLADICSLLEAGKNVVTVVGYLYPAAHGPEVEGRIARACAQGGSTFHSTGLNPGWLGDLLPVVICGLSRDVDCITVREITNFEFYPSPEIMFDSMGFASSEDDFQRQGARRRHWLNGLFNESIRLTADGVGIALDEVTTEMEVALAPTTLSTAAGEVPEGSVAGQHWTWTGHAEGEVRVVHETVWRMHSSVGPDWPTGNNSVTVSGEPSVHIEFKPTWISDGLMATAMHAVNAIAAVVSAPPGICTLLDLPRALRR